MAGLIKMSPQQLNRNLMRTVDYETAYRICPYPSTAVIGQLSKKYRKQPKSVRNWFYLRRQADGISFCRKCIWKLQQGKKLQVKRCSCLNNEQKVTRRVECRRSAMRRAKLRHLYIKPEPVDSDESSIQLEHHFCSTYIKSEPVETPQKKDLSLSDPRMNPVVMLQRIHLMCGSPLCQRCKGMPAH